MSRRLAWTLALGVLFLGGCQQQQVPPLATPSSDQPGYATRYPDQMSSTRTALSDQEGQARRTVGTFATFPDALDKPNWADVLKVYEAADAAGHSAEYVARIRETHTVSAFFKDEKDEISKKVGGAANYQAKQKGCDVDLYGTTTGALDKAVEKQLEKRLRERSEAQTYIDEHEESLGKPNREKLEKQADDISLASYLTRVGVEQTKRDLQELIAQANDVKSTLDRTIEESKATASDAKRSESEKKKALARQAAAEKAKSRVDQETEEAKKLLEQVDERIKTLRSEYDKAFDELKKKTQEKASSSGAKS